MKIADMLDVTGVRCTLLREVENVLRVSFSANDRADEEKLTSVWQLFGDVAKFHPNIEIFS